jgi:hypothetical protein
VLAGWRQLLENGRLDLLPDTLRVALQRIPADVARARVFAGVADATLSDDALAELVRTQVDRLLDALLAQRDEAGPAGST